MGSVQAISELAGQLYQLRSEMIFIDPSDEATLIAFNKQAEEIVSGLLQKGEGLGRYITFLKGEQKVIEAEADEWKAVAQKTANRAKAVEATIKWLMENPIRNVIVSTNKPLLSDTRKFQIVKAPPAYKSPADNPDAAPFDIKSVEARMAFWAEGTTEHEGAKEVLKYVVHPEPYVDWTAMKNRMRELRKILTDEKEMANHSQEDLDAMTNEFKNLQQYIDITQGDYVRMY